ncbi:protein of unknown function [Hyphomicrobium sp. MC1]|nr:protein of unknown function [Hyphomicrobium sp. MC1]
MFSIPAGIVGQNQTSTSAARTGLYLIRTMNIMSVKPPLLIISKIPTPIVWSEAPLRTSKPSDRKST